MKLLLSLLVITLAIIGTEGKKAVDVSVTATDAEVQSKCKSKEKYNKYEAGELESFLIARAVIIRDQKPT